MNRKPLIKKANARKIRLIKKYARIRFHRFWKEWGVTKEEVGMFVGASCVVLGVIASNIIASIF